MTARRDLTGLQRMERNPIFDPEERFDVTLRDGSPAKMTAAEVQEAFTAAVWEMRHLAGVQINIEEKLQEALNQVPFPAAPTCTDWCSGHHNADGWDNDVEDDGGGYQACQCDVYRANPGPSGVVVAVERTATMCRGDVEARVGVPLVYVNGESFAPSQARKIAKALRAAADIADGNPYRQIYGHASGLGQVSPASHALKASLDRRYATSVVDRQSRLTTPRPQQ